MAKERIKDNDNVKHEEEIQDEFKNLLKIMEQLRGPGGCPWDKKQDYYSLQPYILEEAYEVVEALQNRDIEGLKAELGDLLLQVVFEAQIGAEKGDFDLSDVLSEINEKLVRRHPHVFDNLEVDSVSEVKDNWDDIKKQEQKSSSAGFESASLLDELSQSNPALIQSFEIQEQASQVGFDWQHISGVLAKIEEEVVEVKEAIKQEQKQELEQEIGDLLFSVVNLARFEDINPELALLLSVNKFKKRFKYIEKQLQAKGLSLEEQDLQVLEEYWQEAKQEQIKER